MIGVLLALSALARPPGFEPDLSFKETVLIAPKCVPGTHQTWDIKGAIEGRSHGRDRRDGGRIDTPIRLGWERRVSLECLSNSPLKLRMRMSFAGEDAGFALLMDMPDWETFTVTEVEAVTDEARKAGETWKLRGNLRDTLAWVFPPMAKDSPKTGESWDGGWALELGPWWDCHGRVEAGAVEGDARAFSLRGRCEQISYNGTNRVSGTFMREDAGFGVVSALWKVDSDWEHYDLHNDTEQLYTVTRVEEKGP